MTRTSRFPAILFFALTALVALPTYADKIEYFAGGEEGRRIEFGSGRDGAFSDGPTQTGITVVGAAISVDTDVKSVYEFSSFELTAGATLTASGSHPLIIRVTGTASIDGILQSDGGTGGVAAAASPGATGGEPGAGGGRGGIGGERAPVNANATVGSSREDATSQGGGIRANVLSGGADTQYSGGGGCHSSGGAHPATNGIHPSDSLPGGLAGACSASPAATADSFETNFSATIAGGAGGGGGSTQTTNANGINGAGGGGGGGAIRISAFGDLAVSGTIRVRGGAGGAPTIGGGGDYGAAGGGGAGGAIWLQTASTLSGAGTLVVTGGAGGTDAASIGGDGSRGVIRLDSGLNSFTGTFTPAGAADRVYTVLPVTTEFTLSGGPACGTLGRQDRHGEGTGGDGNLLSFVFLASIFGAMYIFSRRNRFTGRRPS